MFAKLQPGRGSTQPSPRLLAEALYMQAYLQICAAKFDIFPFSLSHLDHAYNSLGPEFSKLNTRTSVRACPRINMSYFCGFISHFSLLTRIHSILFQQQRSRRCAVILSFVPADFFCFVELKKFEDDEDRQKANGARGGLRRTA